jgi:hypothetical protein
VAHLFLLASGPVRSGFTTRRRLVELFSLPDDGVGDSIPSPISS